MDATEIRSVRKQLGLTQVKFGNLLGVHSLTVSRWERGTVKPSPYRAVQMIVWNRVGKGRLRFGEALYLLYLPDKPDEPMPTPHKMGEPFMAALHEAAANIEKSGIPQPPQTFGLKKEE